MRRATALAVFIRRLSISTQFTLKIYATGTNCRKTLNLYFKSSRSFKVIDVDTNKKFVMISSMYVPIWNRFHSTRANNGILTTF